MTFEKGTDYKLAFTNKVDQLINIKPMPTAEERVEMVNQLIEDYVSQLGEVPFKEDVSRLTNWILWDSSRDVDKVTNEEYPVMSKQALDLRKRREFPSEHIENATVSTQHKINGKRKPKQFRVFGEYGGN